MSFSKIESDRFGQVVHRFDFAEVDRDALRAIRAARPDVAMVRIPSEQIDELWRLEIFGVAPLVADTLVYYECDLEAHQAAEPRNSDLRFEIAGPNERTRLADLVSTVFSGYKNHYASNPLFAEQDVLDGYTDWGLSYLEDVDGLVCWALYDGDRPVAFANCKQEGESFEGVLFGVHPDYAGRGIYGDLITFTQNDGIARGCKSMLVSTQIQNLAVQRAWVRRGFRISGSKNTVHLNLLLSEQCLASAEEEIGIDERLVEEFGHLVGDLNPVHFDDEAGREAGFEGRIAHGALLNGFVSKLLGTRLPGKGTIYLSQKSSYLKPVYLGKTVRVQIRIKHVDRERGRLIAATHVLDAEGALVFAGHAELLNPGFVASL